MGNLLAPGLARDLAEQPDEIVHNSLISACVVALRRGRPSFDARRRAIIPGLAVELFPDPARLSCVVSIREALHKSSVGIEIIALLDAIPGDQFRRFDFLNQIGVNESRAIRQIHSIPRTPRHVAGDDNSYVLFRRSAFFAIGRRFFSQVGVLEDDKSGFHRLHPIIRPARVGWRWGQSCEAIAGQIRENTVREVSEIGFEIGAIVTVLDGFPKHDLRHIRRHGWRDGIMDRGGRG